MKQVMSSRGRQIWIPSLAEIEEADECGEGFCLVCGNVQGGCEPDARKYTCDVCGAQEVYGAAEFAIRGWVSEEA